MQSKANLPLVFVEATIESLTTILTSFRGVSASFLTIPDTNILFVPYAAWFNIKQAMTIK
jgi:hypothetical protein